MWKVLVMLPQTKPKFTCWHREEMKRQQARADIPLAHKEHEETTSTEKQKQHGEQVTRRQWWRGTRSWEWGREHILSRVLSQMRWEEIAGITYQLSQEGQLVWP